MDIRRLPLAHLLVIGGGRRSFRYPVAAFAVPPGELQAALAAGFQCFPAGRQCWARYRSQQRLADHLFGYRPCATHVLAFLLTAVFGLEWLTGSIEDPLGLTVLGANLPAWVREGEVHRLFTASFLHLNVPHLVFNLLGLLGLGTLLERLLGSRKLLLIHLLACLSGSLMSALLGKALLSVGASTAVFGLLGALAVVNLAEGSRLPPGFRQSLSWWCGIVSINVLLPVLVPAIDWRAHLGGLAGGVVVTVCFLRADGWPRKTGEAEEPVLQLIERWRATSAGERWLSAVLVLSCLWSVLVVGLNYREREVQVDRLIADVGRMQEASAPLRNLIAWAVVLKDDASTAQLQAASELMEEGVAAILDGGGSFSDGNKAAQLDTYASLLFRRGEYREAALFERRALDFAYRRFYASQYARFLHAHFQQNGVLLLGGASDAEVEIVRDATREDSVVKLRRQDASRGDLVVALAAATASVRVGYLLCRFDADREVTLASGHRLFGEALADMTFTVQMIDMGNGHAADSGRCRASRVDGEDDIPG